MKALSEIRPIFHNEADFQHAVAWQLHVQHPAIDVRLEVRPLPDLRWFLDIFLVLAKTRIAVELKYLTRRLEVNVAGEQFSLRDQSANDIRRYDVVKDVARLERIIDSDAADVGYAVVLTNDQSYWREWTARAVADAAFRIHHGRVLEGEAAWGPAAGPGTRAGREDPIYMRGSYTLDWRDYSRVAEGPRGELRYMAVAIVPQAEHRS